MIKKCKFGKLIYKEIQIKASSAPSSAKSEHSDWPMHLHNLVSLLGRTAS